MIKPKCDKCGLELEDFGGLAFSPPVKFSETSTVVKLHLCKTCWEEFLSWLKTPRPSH